MTDEEEHTEITHYGDEIVSHDAPVPLFLRLTYIVLPIAGLISLYFFWNGSAGWLDRGYWQQLQRAAITTVPYENFNEK